MSPSMNPSSSPEQGSPAPAAASERQHTYKLPEAQLGRAEAPVLAEASSGAPASLPTIPLPALDSPVPASNQPAGPSAGKSVVPVTADDADLIEKEWVMRAKEVIEHHRNDPFEQSKQLNVVKVEYMKKRYNKTVKLI